MGWLRLDPDRPGPEEVVSAASMMNCASVRKVAVFAHIGRGNLGDEATMAAIIQNVRLRHPCAEIRAFTLNPADTHARHGVPAFPIRRLSDPSPATGARHKPRLMAPWLPRLVRPAASSNGSRRCPSWAPSCEACGARSRPSPPSSPSPPFCGNQAGDSKGSTFSSLPGAVNLGTISGARGDFPIPFSNGR